MTLLPLSFSKWSGRRLRIQRLLWNLDWIRGMNGGTMADQTSQAPDRSAA